MPTAPVIIIDLPVALQRELEQLADDIEAWRSGGALIGKRVAKASDAVVKHGASLRLLSQYLALSYVVFLQWRKRHVPVGSA